MDGFDRKVLNKWDALFVSIILEKEWIVDLSDAQNESYDLSNDRLMSWTRPRLVDALRSWSRHRTGVKLLLGSKFLSTMTTDAQQSFFHDIFTLPFIAYISLGDGDIPQVTIDTPALLDALSQTDGQLGSLCLYNFALASAVQVQQLADIIAANKERLFTVDMLNIECPVHRDERNRDGQQEGFLDPILDALSQLQDNHGQVCGESKPLPFSLVMSPRTPPTSSLVSPESLCSFLGSAKFKRMVNLTNMGLGDDHCLAIAEHVRTWLANGDNRKGWMLKLHSNPSITEDGYKALVKAARCTRDFPRIILDDKRWEDEINFVRKMNRRYGRLDYLNEHGAFPSRERWLEWLDKAANIRNKSSRHSSIYCTLCEHPDFIRIPSSIPSERQRRIQHLIDLATNY